MGLADIPAVRPISSATLTPMRGCSAISFAKRLIWAVKPRRLKPTSIEFAGSQTANRLVLTVGKYTITDLFDTNKYANNPKSDFLNWSLINAGTFDYAGDGWGYTYGAAAEWYQGCWTLRGGAFDLSQTPPRREQPLGWF